MRIERFRHLALRGFVVLLCLAALADIRPLGGAGEALPVAVIDVSASIGEAPVALPEGLGARPHWILVADGWEDVVGRAQAPRLARGATHLGAALRHVRATWPGADVLLVTDGRATDPDTLPAARSLAAAGGRVFTVPPARVAAGVGLLSAHLLRAAPTPAIRALVAASTSGRAELRLVRDGRVMARRTLVLAPGFVQTVDLEDAALTASGATYHLVLVPAPGTPDDDGEDNRLAVGLRPERRVVLAWGVPAAATLATADDLVIRVARDPEPAALAGADCVVLGNLPWREIGPGWVRALERFVAGGGRLLLLGGPDAYAAGGWAGSPLEERLAPLRVPREKGTGLALVLAIDHSGSTQGATLAAIQEAARRALQGLVPGERMAVLPFAGRPAAALLAPGVLAWGEDAPLRVALAKLDALKARGATDLPAAIRAAARFAAGIEARERRVLLLTDGDPDHPPDPAALRAAAADLSARGVRFGALVVGDQEAVIRLRAALARAPTDVQALDASAEFAAQLLHRLGDLRGRQAHLVGRPSRLVAAGPEAAPFSLEGFQPIDLQRLEAAVDHGARVLVWADDDGREALRVPFAATRSVGAGVVAALAWGPAAEVAAARPAALSRLRPWIAALASAADRGLATAFDGEDLVVRWEAEAGAGAIEALAAGGRTRLIEAAPGVFRGPLPSEADAGVRVRPAGATGGARPLRLPSRPEAEHRGVGVDEAALQAIAEAGGGRRLAAGEVPPVAPAGSGPPLAPWFLLLACILLAVDRLWARPAAAEG